MPRTRTIRLFPLLASFGLGGSFAALGPACGSSHSPSAPATGPDGGALGVQTDGGTAIADGSPSGKPDTSPGSTMDGGVDGSDAATLGVADAGAESATPDAAKSAQYICAPSARTIGPASVYKTSGAVTNAQNLVSGMTGPLPAATLSGAGAMIILDFGTEVGGIVSLAFAGSSDPSQGIGIAFSESSLYAGPSSDQSNGSGTADGYIAVPVAGAATYTVPDPLLRGGFRYLTLFLTSSGSVDIASVSLAYSPDPDRAVPNQYPNYFYSNDETLNKAWYAGAYTFQTNIARNGQGRAWPPVSTNWNNANTIGELGDVVLTDGAKRDRTVWPGDMGISLSTGYAALFDLTSAKNSLQTLYNHQNTQGQLPYAGPPMNFGGSDTYHLWTLFGTYLYYLYSGDKAWLDAIWPKFKLGVSFSLGEVDGSGLLNVTNTNDWARDGQGGENVEANAILYGVLTRAAMLAGAEGDTASQTTYANAAASLKTAVNGALWDASVGAFKDNPTSTLYPQDGNALAAWFGLAATTTQAKGLSYVLNENWNTIGSRGPEFTIGSGVPKISPYAGSMELFGHFALSYDARGLDMIRTMWGFMLSSPNGTGCTFWEGYNADGSFAYDDYAVSFTSLSHGWSTGPTSALTFYTLGVAPDTAAGATYHVVPHPGDLTHVEGTLTMGAGKSVTVNYDVGASCSSFSLSVDASTNSGSTGTIAVPRFGATHTVTIDGNAAWDGASFVATPGVGGATQDSDYIYFTGVAPAAHVFAYGDGKACPPAPETWTFCADENGTCAFAGTKRVRFGKQGKYNYSLLTGGTPCTTASFGGTDPAPNIAKSCAVSDELYTICAAENATCTAGTGASEVRFGANGQWLTQPIAGGQSVTCNAVTFGSDPIANVVKRCEWK